MVSIGHDVVNYMKDSFNRIPMGIISHVNLDGQLSGSIFPNIHVTVQGEKSDHMSSFQQGKGLVIVDNRQQVWDIHPFPLPIFVSGDSQPATIEVWAPLGGGSFRGTAPVARPGPMVPMRCARLKEVTLVTGWVGWRMGSTAILIIGRLVGTIMRKDH